MTTQLEALERGSEQRFHTGKHTVQLEIPSNSSLTETDIDRILRISSWDGDINSQVDGYEGGRSVLIKRASTRHMIGGLELNGLQISGVCYNPLGPSEGGFHTQSRHSEPPRLDNFEDLPEAKGGATASNVRSGRFIADTNTYKPVGSYEDWEWRAKIKNTQIVSDLQMNFYTPSVEAYGRYIDLVRGSNSLGFVIFSIPDIELQRFTAQTFKHMLNNPDEPPLPYFMNIGFLLGQSARELHDHGYVHRELHLGNFYHLEDQNKLYIMDWASMIPLDGSVRERAMKRSIDIGIPLQQMVRYFDRYASLLSDEEKYYFGEEFFIEQLRAYAGAEEKESLWVYWSYRQGNLGSLVDFVHKKFQYINKRRR